LSKGLNLAVAVFCLALAFSLVAGIGFLSAAGVSGGPAIAGQGDDVAEEVGGNQSADDFGAQGTADITLTPITVAMAFYTLILDTSTALQWIGLPQAAADIIELFVRMGFGLFILGIMRGVVFDQ
jgi:hypothetical protein